MPSPRPLFRYINGTPIYNVWDNDFDIIRKGNFLHLFNSQLFSEGVQIDDLCIFDCTNEGIAPNDIELMLSAISTDYPNLEIRVLFNTPINSELPYMYRSFPEHMVAHCNFLSHVDALGISWDDVELNKQFISLQRRASVGRLKFTKKLLDTFADSQYIISCATQPNKWLNELPDLKEAIHPYTVPILVDGVIDNDTKQHYHSDVGFFQCLINVVTETSSQSDDDSWREVFLTEKTFKAFAYRQLPMWFSVPKTVQAVRDLGFDVFDDIIDHGYDDMYDENIRMEMIVGELERLCNDYSIHDMNVLRGNLWNRISKNTQLLNNLVSMHRLRKHELVLELINGI
jgi:hypothetical protein